MIAPTEELWNMVVDASVAAQVLDGPHQGLVLNPVINDFYYRETAFAAKIFAAEWYRTRNSKYQWRSKIALDALACHLKAYPISQGIDEPTLTPRGLRYRKGSIPATILLVFAAQEAANILQQDFSFDAEGLHSYLANCHMGRGKFYHDVIAKGDVCRLAHVVNTSAMAFLFYGYLLKERETKNIVCLKSEISNAIVGAQRSDGFWPYLDPGTLQRLFYMFDMFLPVKAKTIYNRMLLDQSIYFGDGVHHCITLYCLLKGSCLSGGVVSSRVKSAILNGWRFLRKNLVAYEENHVRFNFDWELRPRCFRHCNFIDTSTYFYIFDILFELSKYSLIAPEEAQQISDGMARHILRTLVRPDGIVDGYEGPNSIKDLILPRPSESIFDKGFYLSNTIMMGGGGV